MKAKVILKNQNRTIITAGTQTGIREAMQLLISNNIGCLPVVDDSDGLVGIISDKDIFRKVHADPQNFLEAEVGDLMTTDVIVGLPDDEVSYIAGVMTNNRIRHIPVVDNKRLVGLISIGDIVKIQMDDIKTENRYLKQYLEGSYPG